MKKYISTFSLCLLLGTISCNDWLLEPSPGMTKIEDFFTSGTAANQSVTAAYVPLMWEFQDTYFPEWIIGDVVSDDALKGGQSIGDMSPIYDMENFKTATNNSVLLQFYRAQYQGISRSNLALREIGAMEPDTSLSVVLKNRFLGEASFLRAMYYFRLVRVFGGVPQVDFVIESSNKWQQPRATVDQIYTLIENDLKRANALLIKKSEYDADQMGRATKGAAQAMLLKVALYRHDYTAAMAWGDSIISSGEYDLVENYADNFSLAGENGEESVFEIQYMVDPQSDYGEGNGFTRGTFSPIMTRTRASIAGGWGFNKPTQNLYDEYEEGDIRRDATILNPKNEEMDTPQQEIYLGSRYLNRKYAMINSDGTYEKLLHATRGAINTKVIRYADVLLMFAEACCEANDLGRAKSALNKVRDRVAMPLFPYGDYVLNLSDLRKAIRHERRVELAMEGHRWFDLCRWGIAKQTMDAYKEAETPEARFEMAEFVAGKHELFPIPSVEIDINPMTQNPHY